MIKRRLLWIVLDGVGIGNAPDAHLYGDAGANTLKHVAAHGSGLRLPHLGRMGLGHLTTVQGVEPVDEPIAAFGRVVQRAAGKDSTTGHWEMAGLCLTEPFPTYSEGFPQSFIEAFEQSIGRSVIGNVPASGTEIIARLGPAHEETAQPIVYTSADSVFQIAAHEDVVPLALLYEWCEEARRLLQGEHGVARVIARPFIGSAGDYVRTASRKDFSLVPPQPTVLDHLTETGIDVYSVGKIDDLFAGRGITHAFPTKNNADGVQQMLALMARVDAPAVVFANLVDFDTLYGHRNNPAGFGAALEAFDNALPDLINTLKADDIVIITADHGNDPTMPGTDHSREKVPLIVYGQSVKPGTNLGERSTLADVGRTVADLFNVTPTRDGASFADLLV